MCCVRLELWFDRSRHLDQQIAMCKSMIHKRFMKNARSFMGGVGMAAWSMQAAQAMQCTVDMQCGCIMHECRCFRLGGHQRCDQACQPISPCVYRRIDWFLYWHHVSQHAAVMIYVDKLMSRCRGLRDPVVDPHLS